MVSARHARIVSSEGEAWLEDLGSTNGTAIGGRTAGRPRDSDRLTIVIIASDEVNAFAHLGGYVYLHKGMLDFAESDAELQFVLAHEIAHIELGHCARKVTYAAREILDHFHTHPPPRERLARLESLEM